MDTCLTIAITNMGIRISRINIFSLQLLIQIIFTSRIICNSKISMIKDKWIRVRPTWIMLIWPISLCCCNRIINNNKIKGFHSSNNPCSAKVSNKLKKSSPDHQPFNLNNNQSITIPLCKANNFSCRTPWISKAEEQIKL